MLKELIQKLRGKKPERLYRSGWETDSTEHRFSRFIINDIDLFEGRPKKGKKKDTRIDKKPVEIFKEIISETPKLDLSNLDEKIKVIEKRKKFITEELEGNVNDECEALAFLKARKKYEPNKDLFNWSVVTLSSIGKLEKKYKVKMVKIDNYTKTMPEEAIDELEKYLQAYKKVRDDAPVIKLIVDEGGKEDKKDPILLASSPFGKFFHFLGAWDKEVKYVDEIIYKGK